MLGWEKWNSWPTDDNVWLTLTCLKVWHELWKIVKGLGMSGVSSHMLSPLASNKEEPHVPTGCFLRMWVLEAEYRNRLLLCSKRFCPLQEVTWDQDNEKPGDTAARDARRNVSKGTKLALACFAGRASGNRAFSWEDVATRLCCQRVREGSWPAVASVPSLALASDIAPEAAFLCEWATEQVLIQ